MAWDSVLGKPAEEAFADNTDKWSGDHSMAAELVPGVLLANRKLGASRPGLADLGPTVLDLFGLTPSSGMEGRSVFTGGARA